MRLPPSETGKLIHSEVISIVKKYNPKQILDLGSGPGEFVQLLHKDGFDVTASDIVPSLFQFKDIKFLKFDLNKLITVRNKFDMITATEVIEHVESPSKLINDAYSLLNHNGYFVFSTPNNESLFARIHFLCTGMFPMFRGHLSYFIAKGKKELGFPHIHPIFTWQIKQLVHDKFAIQEIRFNRGYFPLIGTIPLKNKFFGQNLIFVLRKIN